MAVFGYTGNDGNVFLTLEDNIRGGGFICPSGGTPTSISARVENTTTDSRTYKCAIYKISTLALVAETEEKTKNTATIEVLNFNVTSVISNLIPGEQYFICCWTNATAGVGRIYYTDSAGLSSTTDAQAYGAWPNPLVPTAAATHRLDVSCTYTELDGTTGQSQPPFVL